MEGSASRKAPSFIDPSTDERHSVGSGITIVPLSKLSFDARVWPRQGLDRERVASFASLYEERGAEGLPPLEAVDRKQLLVSDGFTRGAAAKVAGLTEVPTIVLQVPQGEDPVAFAFLRAIQASTGGAKQLSRAECHAGIARLIAQTHLGDVEIAALFGVSKATIWRQRQKASGVSHETRADAGETYLADATALEVATRIFRGLSKVYEARGLGVWDALTSDHTGSRLARVLADAYGEGALEQAQRFRAWIDDAVVLLGEGGGR